MLTHIDKKGNAKIVDVSKKIIIPLSLMLIVLLITTFYPDIALYLPNKFIKN